MGMPYITKFCWCMGLELGSKVIGYLHLMASLAIVCVCAATAGSAWGQAGGQAGGEGDEEGVYLRLASAAIVVACFSLVHVALALTLIYAVHKRKMLVVRVWALVMCVLWAGALLFVLVSAAASRPHGSGSDIFLAFLEGTLFFGTVGYCILCVHSYYLVLRSGSDMQGPPKHDY
ncbi:uncharacterized protein LOC106708406 [Papilio machaon]|uniref:uncharacterized protein LOC106708406 n=1 Tax=Papilio machaon TaxID=76193 RepID=UPI001E6636DE|nr:uncharacterized protein LOC106708406 [Papilio machaon]